MGELLKGQVAIITGSGQGIGKELALWMAREGCRVITNNRKKGSSLQAHDGKIVKLDEDDIKKISAIVGDAETAAAYVNADEQVKQAGGEAYPVYSDVSTAEGCKKLVDAALERWGRVDILVINAAATWTGNFKDMTIQNWETCVRSKLDQAFYLMHYAVPDMKKRNYGRIIMAASEAHMGLEGMCGYSAACGGVTAYAKAVAQDLAEDGITVNAYTPNAGTRSWFNMLAEYREEGYDVEAIEEGSPAAQKFPPDRMVGFLGYMCLPEFTASGLCVSVCADGEAALWTNYTKYNTIFKDIWSEGPWTVEDIRGKMPELLHKVFYTRTRLAVTKSEYGV